MKALFISDLHLSPSHPEITEVFLRFLENEVRGAKALYILGDFFDAWIGDDNPDPFIKHIIKAVAHLKTEGISVFFLHGNRDFLIGERFAEQSQCVLLSDPYVVELFGKRYVLTHGDTLCTLDTNYQRFRSFVRNAFIKKLYLSLSLTIRTRIAHFLRKQSTRPRNPQSEIPQKYDVTRDAVHKILKQFQADVLIHGHTHRPGIHSFSLNGKAVKRIVLGDWGTVGSALLITPTEETLIKLT